MAEAPVNTKELVDSIKKYGLEYLGVYYGKYRGQIVDTKDPLKLGRVKVRVPQVGSDETLDWAWPSGQPVGNDFGDSFIPPVDSPVWVSFENGNPSHPVFEGGHWASENHKVPEEATDPRNRVRKSENWIMEMNDAEDKFRITSKQGGHYVELDGEGNFKISAGKDATTDFGGDKKETVSGSSEETATGDKSITCAGFGLTATSGNFSMGGVSITCGNGVLEFNVGGASLKISAGGVEIMGKDFISHTHPQSGGGNTGGVN